MRIIVTGGLGFIGSVVARRLIEEGDRVLIVDDGRDSVAEGMFPESMVLRAPMESAPTGPLSEFGADVAMLFAGSSSVPEGERKPGEYLENNVSACHAFVENLLEQGCRNFVYSGTAAVYGVPGQCPIDESHPTQPVSWYGWTKLVMERYLARMAGLGRLRCVTFRYFNAGGAAFGIVERRRHEHHLIPLALQSARSGLPLTIYGTDYPTPDGTCIRDFVHVLDLAEAHVAAARGLSTGSAAGAVVNLGTGRGQSVLEVVRTVEEVTGRRVETVPAARREGDPAVLVASCSAASRLYGWSARRSLKEMVADAWEPPGKSDFS